jgi:hypothetical protein
MNLKITPLKAAIAFVVGIALLVFSGLLANIRWLFIAIWFIGLGLMISSMAYLIYRALFYILNKLNKD